MTVWLMQCVCENHHCIVAAAYEDGAPNAAETALVMIHYKLARRAHGACSICGARRLSFEKAPTICPSIEIITAILASKESKNRGSVDLIEYVNKTYAAKELH